MTVIAKRTAISGAGHARDRRCDAHRRRSKRQLVGRPSDRRRAGRGLLDYRDSAAGPGNTIFVTYRETAAAGLSRDSDASAVDGSGTFTDVSRCKRINAGAEEPLLHRTERFPVSVYLPLHRDDLPVTGARGSAGSG